MRALSVTLLIIGAILAAYTAALAYWVDGVLLDTPTFVSAMEPVVEDDAVRDAAANRISDAVVDAIDVASIAGAILPGEGTPLAAELVAGFDGFVRETVSSATQTETFARLFLTEVRRWHVTLTGVVRSGDEELFIEDTAVRVTLGPYVDLLIEQADNVLLRGVLSRMVPESVRQMRVAVFDARHIADRLALLQTLDTLRPYLIPTAVASFALALAFGRDRSWVLLGTGVGSAMVGAVFLLGAWTEAGRIEGLMRSAFSASPQSASLFTGALFGPLERSIGTLLVASLLVAALGALILRRSGRDHPFLPSRK